MSASGSPPRFLIGCAAAVTGAILLAAAWALTREPPPLAIRRLSNGYVIRLEAVTCGPVHRFKGGPYWQRLLARAPLQSLRALAGDPIREFRGATPDSLVFWTTRNGNIGYLGDSVEAINERGCSYEVDCRDSTTTANQLLQAWEAVAAPRRGKKLGLRWRTPGFPTRALMIPNPWTGPYPEWSLSSLPVAKQDGELGVTLASLATGPEVRRTGPRTFPMDPDWLEAHLRFTWAGKPGAGWMPVGGTLRDPTGNVLGVRIDSSHRHDDREDFRFSIGVRPLRGLDVLGHYDDREDFQFPTALCADEPVWKLRLELVPRTLSSIHPADLWIIPWLPLPHPRAYSQTGAQFSRHDIAVVLARRSSSPVFTIDAVSTLTEPGVRLRLVRAVDDRGRSIQHPDTGDTGLRQGMFGCALWTAPDARKVRLVFAVVKSRFVEFVVRPSRAQDLPKHARAH